MIEIIIDDRATAAPARQSENLDKQREGHCCTQNNSSKDILPGDPDSLTAPYKVASPLSYIETITET